jgi:hypothetical protein
MARSLSSGNLTAIESGHYRLAFFISAQFVSSLAYVWNGVSDIVWDGHTWVGMGNIINISAVSEATDMGARNITLTLNGVPSDMVSKLMGECRQNFPVNVWLGLLADDGTIISDPYQPFSGHMDVPTFAEGLNDATISLTCENPLIDMGRAPARRFTHDDQKIDFPTDEGFKFVSAIQSWNGTWGKSGPGATLPGMSIGSTGQSQGPSRTGTNNRNQER